MKTMYTSIHNNNNDNANNIITDNIKSYIYIYISNIIIHIITTTTNKHIYDITKQTK